MSEQFVLDNVAIPNRTMLEASQYYPNYIRHGGKKTYQEYIQLAERSIDGGSKTELPEFMKQHFREFVDKANFSNNYWSTHE